MKATQSNFPTRRSAGYHQRTSHTGFSVCSLQYAELVEKVQVTPAPPPQGQQWLASSHGCSLSLSTPLCSSGGTTESRPDIQIPAWSFPPVPPGTKDPSPPQFNTIMTPRNWTLLLASVTSTLKTFPIVPIMALVFSFSFTPACSQRQALWSWSLSLLQHSSPCLGHLV